jgi:hypothetical protein
MMETAGLRALFPMTTEPAKERGKLTVDQGAFVNEGSVLSGVNELFKGARSARETATDSVG